MGSEVRILLETFALRIIKMKKSPVNLRVYRIIDGGNKHLRYLARISGKCTTRHADRFVSSNLGVLARAIWKEYEYSIFYPFSKYELDIRTSSDEPLSMPYVGGTKRILIMSREKRILESYFEDFFWDAIAHKWG